MGFQLKRNNENTFSFFLLMVFSNNPTHACVTGRTDIKDLCITSSSPKYAENITRQFFVCNTRKNFLCSQGNLKLYVVLHKFHNAPQFSN